MIARHIFERERAQAQAAAAAAAAAAEEAAPKDVGVQMNPKQEEKAIMAKVHPPNSVAVQTQLKPVKKVSIGKLTF